MSAPYREINVRLHRDAFNTPWGFRLQGGRDFKGPLTVQRVFVGSPADGELQRGDVIVSIESHSAGFMVHKQAQDIIKAAGGTLQMVVKRGLQQRFGVAGATPESTQPASNQPFRSRGFDNFAPKADPKIGAFSPTKSPGFSTDLGVDYGSGHRYPGKPKGSNMLNRVNQSLSQAIYEDGIDYSQRSMHDLRSAFSGPTHLSGQYNKPPEFADSYSSTRSGKPQKWHRPAGGYGQVPVGLVEPGWTPPKQTEMGWTPSRQHVKTFVPQESYLEKQSRPVPPPVNRPPPQHRQQHHHVPSNYHVPHQEPGPPAWAGSLRGAGGPKPWEVHAAAAAVPTEHAPPQHQQAASPRQPPQNAAQGSAFTPHQPRVQNVHYGPGQTTPLYSQKDTGGADHTDTARVAHLQYNTPLGLYSRENAEDVLRSQTGGKPGDGTMVITGGGGGKSLDLSKSETYRLIHEQERGGPRSARNIEHRPGQEMHYQGFQDQKKQSPSMHALEHFVGEEPAGQQAHQGPQGQQAVSHGQPAAAHAGGGGGEEPEGQGYSDF